jgi:COP9 signalosome complex subunit 1
MSKTLHNPVGLHLANHSQFPSTTNTLSTWTLTFRTIQVCKLHTEEMLFILTVRTGRTAVDRLIHIVATCPSIASQAFHLAVQYIHQLRDPSLYQTALSVYEQCSETPEAHDALDPNWIEETMSNNQRDRMKLEVELKAYTNNMIKESIRVI